MHGTVAVKALRDHELATGARGLPIIMTSGHNERVHQLDFAAAGLNAMAWSRPRSGWELKQRGAIS